jgi:hypothetical protein
MKEMLIEKVRQLTFLYDTKSTEYRDQHIRANAWEGIGKELKTKRKFYVSSRDVRIVCPRLEGTSLFCSSADDSPDFYAKLLSLYFHYSSSSTYLIFRAQFQETKSPY